MSVDNIVAILAVVVSLVNAYLVSRVHTYVIAVKHEFNDRMTEALRVAAAAGEARGRLEGQQQQQ